MEQNQVNMQDDIQKKKSRRKKRIIILVIVFVIVFLLVMIFWDFVKNFWHNLFAPGYCPVCEELLNEAPLN